MATTLENLVFSDLFVTGNNESCWYKQTPDSLKMHSVPTDVYSDISALRAELHLHRTDDFRVEWPLSGGVWMRVCRIYSVNNAITYICRKFRLPAGSMASLGMASSVGKKLLEPSLIEGLVVLFGKAGSGKTTTAGSLVVERLTMYGGVCYTIENPPELDLDGVHGLGVCYQTEISNDDEIDAAMSRIYRGTPNIIFIGELRTGAAVRAALTAATSGHLVVTTFHAADLITGVARLARLAGDDTANAALADALRVAIHVSLHNAENRLPPGLTANNNIRGTGTPPRVLSVEPLWMTDKTSEGLKGMIRGGGFQLLISELDRQRRNFLNS